MDRVKRKLTFYILTRLAIWVTVFTVALIVFFLVALAFGSSRTWQPGIVFEFLNFMRKNTVWFFIMAWASGFVLIFVGFWFRTLGYLEESERAAKDAEQKKNDMLLYLAHDLKTPLTSTIGYLTLLSDEPGLPLETRRKYLDVAIEKTRRLEELINEFFEITRYNLSTLSLNASEVNIARMVEQIAYEFKPVFIEKKLEYDITAEPGLMLRCDADKMRRVFDNLIKNAADYSESGTTINISAFRTGGYVKVKVKNRVDDLRASNSGGSGLPS